MKKLAGASLVIFLALSTVQVNAEVTQRDLQVVARVLGFLEPPFTGETLLGIVYDPSSGRSSQQAENIRQLLGPGMQTGNMLLKPVMVPVREAANAEVDLFFLTEYLDETGEYSGAKRLPCVTTDIEQVRRGACIVGIQSMPRIEIIVNKQAAENSGVKFSSVFRMMIREI